eukprot:2212553-Amphidinium_carterae.1
MGHRPPTNITDEVLLRDTVMQFDDADVALLDITDMQASEHLRHEIEESQETIIYVVILPQSC